MILTWVFRLMFVPLLVLAIITSNCNAARANAAESGLRRVDVAGEGVVASNDGAGFTLVVRVPLTDTAAVDVRLGYLRGNASGIVAEISRSRPGVGVCFDVAIELRPPGRAGVDTGHDHGGIDCPDLAMAAPGPGIPFEGP